ncbi:MAG: ketoacyl-ACP synthase III [Sphingobacteriia bacterium]|nr:ketoacyl-ACP synthase III [Sphingobacteriia bacterium]
MIKAVISGIGSYLPKNVLTNNDLEKIVDTNDEWITTRTGIKQRHIIDADMLTSDLASEASKKALEDAKLSADKIDCIIVATTTPDYTFPATAVKVQANIGASNAFAFDVQAVCAGFIYALHIAKNFIENNQAKNVLVIGAEAMTKILDWKDRTTCVLFGDGAGAIILSAEENSSRGILASKLHSDGNYIDILRTSGGIGVNNGEKSLLLMKGGEVFKHAVEKMHEVIEGILEELGQKSENIDIFIPHQANVRILSSVAKKLTLEENKVVITLDKHANTSAASIPLALSEAYNQKRIKKGDKIMLAAIGGGLAWGAAYLVF